MEPSENERMRKTRDMGVLSETLRRSNILRNILKNVLNEALPKILKQGQQRCMDKR